MNIAIIIAGGVGSRMQSAIPKQFVSVYDKPVIMYTLEAFDNAKNIDEIGVVCLDGWHEVLRSYCKEYGIKKLKWIVKGGNNGQSSIYNGLKEIEKRNFEHTEDILVFIHDAIRPLVSEEIINDAINVTKKRRVAISAVPCNTVVLKNKTKEEALKVIDRDTLSLTQTPQGFYFDDLIKAHRLALSKGITDSVASCSLFVELGIPVYYSLGSETNIKLTTKADMEIFKALLSTKKKN